MALKGYHVCQSLRIEYSEKAGPDYQKMLEYLGNDVFRLSRYGLEKISMKHIIFSQSYSVYLDHNTNYFHFFTYFEIQNQRWYRKP